MYGGRCSCSREHSSSWQQSVGPALVSSSSTSHRQPLLLLPPSPPPPPISQRSFLSIMDNSMAHLNHNPHLAQLDRSLYRNNNNNMSALPPSHMTRYSAPNDVFYPGPSQRIDVDALAAGVQRYIPNPSTANSYIALTAGMDPSTVDFRTFYPYNPSEVKHRKRTTRAQLKILEDTFKRETKPNATLRKSLAAELEMTPRGVQVRSQQSPFVLFVDMRSIPCPRFRFGFKTGERLF